MDTNGRDEVITAKSSLHHAEVRYYNHYMDTNGKGEVITDKIMVTSCRGITTKVGTYRRLRIR
jgi:hypothetical protein